MTYRNFTFACAALLLQGLLLLSGCDSSTTEPMTMVDAGPPPLEMSTLFGPCQEDSQCPGEGAVCRRSDATLTVSGQSSEGAPVTITHGFPGGYCTLPCSDRTPCDYNGVYHHCTAIGGDATAQQYCERRCLNGLDCGRSNYTCVDMNAVERDTGYCAGYCFSDADCGNGFFCNVYSGQCSASAPSTTGGRTGDTCSGDGDCLSGRCGGTTGCISICILPRGYNGNNFFNGENLPTGDCADDAICFPQGGLTRGEQGACLKACTADADCNSGQTCRKSFQLRQGGEQYTFNNGYCTG